MLLVGPAGALASPEVAAWRQSTSLKVHTWADLRRGRGGDWRQSRHIAAAESDWEGTLASLLSFAFMYIGPASSDLGLLAAAVLPVARQRPAGQRQDEAEVLWERALREGWMLRYGEGGVPADEHTCGLRVRLQESRATWPPQVAAADQAASLAQAAASASSVGVRALSKGAAGSSYSPTTLVPADAAARWRDTSWPSPAHAGSVAANTRTLVHGLALPMVQRDGNAGGGRHHEAPLTPPLIPGMRNPCWCDEPGWRPATNATARQVVAACGRLMCLPAFYLVGAEYGSTSVLWKVRVCCGVIVGACNMLLTVSGKRPLCMHSNWVSTLASHPHRHQRSHIGGHCAPTNRTCSGWAGWGGWLVL